MVVPFRVVDSESHRHVVDEGLVTDIHARSAEKVGDGKTQAGLPFASLKTPSLPQSGSG